MTDTEKLQMARFAINALTVLEVRADGAVVIGPMGWDILVKARAALAEPEAVRAEG